MKKNVVIAMLSIAVILSLLGWYNTNKKLVTMHKLFKDVSLLYSDYDVMAMKYCDINYGGNDTWDYFYKTNTEGVKKVFDEYNKIR